MTAPYDPARNQQHFGHSSTPPTAPFSQVPPAQVPPRQAGQFSPAMPGGPLPPAAPRKRASWLLPTLIGVGAFVVLCCGGPLVLGLVGDDKKPQAAAVSGDVPGVKSGAAPANTTAAPATSKAAPAVKTTTAPAPPKPKTPGIGDKVRGGDFEFTVKGVKCGISRVGNDFLNTKAQGTFCKVSVTVKNVTKRAHTFHADGSLSAQDSKGREYEADGEAGIYGNSDGQGFLDEINPGNSVTANVFFDVPKGTKLKTITLDAGLFTFAEDAVVAL
ncbi:DUF4352 domain-containing protein [Micromonospora rifamycinica]|uniref:DUF4352 domain-containing protein n=1 Tax=Micromonospora rifamycinica TaxID=291594 RepID=A0A109IL14_9ACTN|nr:DUF4352 domain-containing protein [Micromonospora rifamycinica]KWV32505.1 hypothetical protein AWV63_11960 [Micromonospora rifamycinica]SCG56042.1 protein of unknown function [Micromonospora rifamycinica]